MKIVCDKCQTKYSIADEKVSGKVFKIRCKKCSHIIVVKGTGAAAGAADATTVTSAAGDDKVWFLVVAGEQVGPFSGAEVRTRFAAGEVDGETYAWREGFGDWLRLSSIEDFRDQLPPAAAPAQNGGDTRRTDVGDMFAQHQQREREEAEASAAEIFGRATAAAARPLAAAARPGASAGDDLFGAAGVGAATALDVAEPPRGRAAASFGGAGPAAASDTKLTGQRNENSMLFSLSNLSAMATSAPAAAAAKPAEAKPGFATAKNEGSGLIDIRAMAAATLSSSSAGSSDGAGDLPSFSAAPVFTPVVAAPVMIPTQQSRMPGWAWALVAVGVLGILGALGTALAIVMRKPEPPVVVQAPPPAPPVAAPVAAPPVAAAPAPAAPAPGAAASAAPVVAAADAHKAAGPHRAGPAAPAGKGAKAGPAPVAAAPEPPRPAPAAGGGRRRAAGNDSLDDLLNAVPDNKASRPSAAPARTVAAAPAAEPDDPNLPQTLEKTDVVSGMKGVEPKVNGCFAQFHVPGTAMVSLTIAKTGRVQNASVLGALAGTPTGDCIAKAVRSAQFKHFRNPTLTVQYPFVLR